jgi:hypothetical protein
MKQDVTQDVLAMLSEKWPSERRVCQICAESNWTISPNLCEVREFAGGNMVVGGPVVPFAVISCTNCGNSHFVNPLILGISRERLLGAP